MQERKLIGKKELKDAERFLFTIDEDWENLINEIGQCDIKLTRSLEPFQALIKSVVFQQLNPKAANSIYKRFLDIFDGSFPNAKKIITINYEILKKCGLSKNKLICIKTIAKLASQKKIPTKKAIQNLSNLTIHEQLQKIKGVGPWTVDMLLIFNLGRLDVMPINDLALKINYQKLKKLKKKITNEELLLISKKWRPYRSIAAWYLWQIN